MDTNKQSLFMTMVAYEYCKPVKKNSARVHKYIRTVKNITDHLDMF
jgi:hypothetical protein